MVWGRKRSRGGFWGLGGGGGRKRKRNRFWQYDTETIESDIMNNLSTLFDRGPSGARPSMSYAGGYPYASNSVTIDLDSDSDDEMSANGEVLFGHLRANIVGIRYYKGTVNDGEMVSLNREPTNMYDRNAIRIDNAGGIQVGHIRREVAVPLAYILDQNLARIDGVVPSGSGNTYSMPIDLTVWGQPEKKDQIIKKLTQHGLFIKAGHPGKGATDKGRSKSGGKTGESYGGSFGGASTSEMGLMDTLGIAGVRTLLSPAEMRNELDDVFKGLQEGDKTTMAEPAKAISTPMYPHQKQALHWMINQENNNTLPPFWQSRGAGYFNTVTVFSTKERPKGVCGGILADDMGLGKTLEMIALIMTNFADGQPLAIPIVGNTRAPKSLKNKKSSCESKSTSESRCTSESKYVSRSKCAKGSTSGISKKLIIINDDEDEYMPPLPNLNMSMLPKRETLPRLPKLETSQTSPPTLPLPQLPGVSTSFSSQISNIVSSYQTSQQQSAMSIALQSAVVSPAVITQIENIVTSMPLHPCLSIKSEPLTVQHTTQTPRPIPTQSAAPSMCSEATAIVQASQALQLASETSPSDDVLLQLRLLQDKISSLETRILTSNKPVPLPEANVVSNHGDGIHVQNQKSDLDKHKESMDSSDVSDLCSNTSHTPTIAYKNNVYDTSVTDLKVIKSEAIVMETPPEPSLHGAAINEKDGPEFITKCVKKEPVHVEVTTRGRPKRSVRKPAKYCNNEDSENDENSEMPANKTRKVHIPAPDTVAVKETKGKGPANGRGRPKGKGRGRKANNNNISQVSSEDMALKENNSINLSVAELISDHLPSLPPVQVPLLAPPVLPPVQVPTLQSSSVSLTVAPSVISASHSIPKMDKFDEIWKSSKLNPNAAPFVFKGSEQFTVKAFEPVKQLQPVPVTPFQPNMTKQCQPTATKPFQPATSTAFQPNTAIGNSSSHLSFKNNDLPSSSTSKTFTNYSAFDDDDDLPDIDMKDDCTLLDVISNCGKISGRTKCKGPRPTLIVCPLSVLSNWLNQFNEHIHENVMLEIYTYYGSNRTNSAAFLGKQDIVLTTYSTLACDAKGKSHPLQNVHWLRLVLDEAHSIRNPNAHQTKAILQIKADRKWALTGTPIQNSMRDLWSLINFLGVSPFTERHWWLRTIERPLAAGEKSALKRVRHLMCTIAMRRTKTQKIDGKPLVELPSRNVYIEQVELSEDERANYEAMQNEGKLVIGKYFQDGTLLHHYGEVLAILMRLRQLCCHPLLVAKAAAAAKKTMEENKHATEDELRKKLVENLLEVLNSGSDEECAICLDALRGPVITHCAHVFCRGCIEAVIRQEKPNAHCPLCRGSLDIKQLVEVPPETCTDKVHVTTGQWQSSSKVDALLRALLKLRLENPEIKSIVVSQFTSLLNLLEIPLSQHGFRFTRLDGTMSMGARVDAIDEFSDPGPNSPTIFLLSLKAGGVGINLTAASRVFLMDPAWNPASEDQCFDRCHRLGQTKDVIITKFVVDKTVENRMMDLQEKKRQLMQGAFKSKKANPEQRRQQRINDITALIDL